MDAYDVGLLKQFLLGAREPAIVFLGAFRREVLTPGDGLHPEGLADARHARAELAQSDHAEGQAFEVRTDRDLPGFAGLEARIFVTDVAREFEDQAKGDAGGRIAEAWCAADHHVVG